MMSDFNKVLISGQLSKPIVWVGMTTVTEELDRPIRICCRSLSFG